MGFSDDLIIQVQESKIQEDGPEQCSESKRCVPFPVERWGSPELCQAIANPGGSRTPRPELVREPG